MTKALRTKTEDLTALTPVPGLTGVYATRQGQIFVDWKDGTKKLRNPVRQPTGNFVVYVPKPGRYAAPQQIHQLLALTFLPRPPQAKQVRFKDGDKSNWSLENLYWYIPTHETVKKHLVIKEFDPFEGVKGKY